MKNNTDQRLWVAAHLLYPNSSQALDVYHTLLQSYPKKNDKDYAKNIFLKLDNYFFKNPTVRSAIPFRIFEDKPMNHWNTFYKKSQKKHLLVIIGLIVFEFSLPELAVLLKTPEEKLRFLLNQAFKKITEYEIKTPTVIMAFRFKKSADNRVSYFFTNENLVEYCLGMTTEKDRKWVEEGLRLYPQLENLRLKYVEVITEIKNLIEADDIKIEEHPLLQVVKPDGKGREKVSFFTFNRGVAAVSVLSMAFIAFTIWRPFTFSLFTLNPSDTSIKIQEVTSQPYSAVQIDEDDAAAISLRELPVESKNSKAEQVAGAGQQPTDSKPVVQAPQPPVQGTTGSVTTSGPSSGSVATNTTGSAMAKPDTTKTIALNPPAQKPEGKSKPGGLYRATIFVTDLETVTGRITEKLVALGGTKAGEVELGWRKSPKVSYYHLTLPEEGVEPAREFLTKFGTLTMQFETHPRVLPPGTKRMILEVKERE